MLDRTQLAETLQNGVPALNRSRDDDGMGVEPRVGGTVLVSRLNMRLGRMAEVHPQQCEMSQVSSKLGDLLLGDSFSLNQNNHLVGQLFHIS